jgi:protein gp37
MTAIEWCRNKDGSPGKTWNPIRARDKKTGKRGWHCEHVHEGCRFCYAERLNAKAGDTGGTGLAYKPGHRADVDIYLDEKTLLAPLAWKKPQRIFVCSMTDLFGEWVTDEWLDKVFAIAALCPQHTFIVLTKRPERMRDYLDADDRHYAIAAALGNMLDGEWIWNKGKRHRPMIDKMIDRLHGVAYTEIENPDGSKSYGDERQVNTPWPLPNVWGLVSCGDQNDADAFIPILLDTPLAKRGVSLEPLLGPIDLNSTVGGTLWIGGQRGCGGTHRGIGTPDCPREPHHHHDERCRPGLDWVIAGGESGKDARPMHPDWARDLQKRCDAAAVPFFFKQWGEYVPAVVRADDEYDGGFRAETMEHGTYAITRAHDFRDGLAAVRVGKKRAGRALDGREHNAWPDDPAEVPFQ